MRVFKIYKGLKGRSVNFKEGYTAIKDNKLDLVDLLNTVVGKDKWFMINRTYTKVVI